MCREDKERIVELEAEVKKLKVQKEALSRQLLLAADAVNREAGFTGIGRALGVTT